MTDDISEKDQKPSCFVIMPIADPDAYNKGHFLRVYEDIFKPACERVGFVPVRADEVKQTNLIHLDILQKLIESPMAICDLSSRNPNVLFELGLRQAFDKPTVLVQEVGTPKIFDIAPLRYTEYRKDLGYRDVLEDQIQISRSIKETYEASKDGTGVNSIVKILALSHPAKLPEASASDSSDILQIVRAEMGEMRSELRHVSRIVQRRSSPRISLERGDSFRVYQYDIDRIRLNVENGLPIQAALEEINSIQMKILHRMDTDISEAESSRGMKIFNELSALEAELTRNSPRP